MPGMKVTLSAAMRARDVSRPAPEDEEAAERAAQSGGRPREQGRPDAERKDRSQRFRRKRR
jgi:hypothetical protein